jgi:hypothetical protein
MIAHVLASGTDRVGVRRSAPGTHRHLPLVQPLHGERSTDLGKEFVVEPVHEPAHFDAWPGLTRQQALLADLDASRFIEIFGDDPRAGNGGVAFLHQHRRGAVGIEGQKLLAALPHPFLGHPCGDAILAECQAYETRVRAEWVMKQRQHAALRIAAISRRADPAGTDKSGCAGPSG